MNVVRWSIALLILAVSVGCDESKEAESASKSGAIEAAPASDTTGSDESGDGGICATYAETIREICLASWEKGLDIPCHRIVTRANVAIASNNEEICRQHTSDLKAERDKKMKAAKEVELGEACKAYVSSIETKCLDRLGDDYPAQCGGAMVTVGKLGPDAEERCRGMAAMLSRL